MTRRAEISSYHALHACGQHQSAERRVLLNQPRDVGAECPDACRELWVARRVQKLLEQNRAAEKFNGLALDGKLNLNHAQPQAGMRQTLLRHEYGCWKRRGHAMQEARATGKRGFCQFTLRLSVH